MKALSFISNYMYVLLIVLLFINMKQRRIRGSRKKQIATVHIALLMMLFEFMVVAIMVFALPPITALAAFGIVIGIGFGLRKKVWPYTLHCKECGKTLSFSYIVGHDDCLCAECHAKAHPEEAVKKEEPKKTPAIEEENVEEKTDELQDSFSKAKSVDEIDWELWEPTDRCVITYVEVDGKLLFIEKKRGLGNGYFNAPGGHIEESETASEAAIRETKEETGLDIENPVFRGILRFQFANGIREIGYVFFADNAKGELKECEEARPFWQEKATLPWENMWADDRLWLPGALEGKKFDACFVFDDREMIDSRVTWLDEEEDE